MPLLAAVLSVLAGLLWLLAGRARRGTGLPAGTVTYSDTSQWARPPKALFSRQLQLAGKPDYIVRQGRHLIPVEVKSMRAPAAGPLPAHVYQLAAYCALISEAYGRRPRHGLIRYADRVLHVDYTPALEVELRELLAAIRAARQAGEPQRSHAVPARCHACGFRDVCDEALD